MRIKNKNFDKKNIMLNRLANKIFQGIDSMINDYGFLFDKKEIDLFNSYKNILFSNVSHENITKIENELKKYAFRTWKYEFENGNKYISWLKDNIYNLKNPVIFSTFGDVESFCKSVIGIEYDVNFDAFIGACEKDAATMVEGSDRKSIYTIMELDNNRVVNSYNLATPIITPKQATSFTDNTYQSKHNEILLDARYAVPIRIICIDDRFIDIAKNISEEYNIPFDKKTL